MTHEAFDQLVREIEQTLGNNQPQLRRRVTLYAIIGYAGLLAGVGFVLLLGACFIVPGIVRFHDLGPLIPLGVLVLAFGGWGTFGSLRVRLPRPQGHSVKRADAPALFAALDDIRQKLRAAPFHHVLVIPDCNAAVVQCPRLGVFGWHENYLLLGMPLLESFSPDEVRSILAHESAHLARSHNKSGQWIYRLRRSWSRIFPAFSKPGARGQILMRSLHVRFIRWFWPRFNAHAFVLSRIHENEADSVACEMFGADATAAGLVRVNLNGRILNERFWPNLWRLSAQQPEPPLDLIQRVNQFFVETAPEIGGSLEKAFLVSTTNADTHPCLSDRLRAIGLEPDARREYATMAAKLPETSAASVFFGSSLESVRAGVNAHWRKRCIQRWNQLHNKARLLQDRLGGMAAVSARKEADEDLLWDQAIVVGELQGNEAAVSLLRRLVADNPRHVRANFALGRLLLESGDASGETFLESAISEDESLLRQAAPVLHSYFQRQGFTDRIRNLYSRLDAFEKAAPVLATERQAVTAADNFIAHELSAEQLDQFHQLFSAFPEIRRLELARKQVQHLRGQNVYVLCVYLRGKWGFPPGLEGEQAVISALFKKVQLPGRVLVIAPSGEFRPVARKLHKLPGANIYRSVK